MEGIYPAGGIFSIFALWEEYTLTAPRIAVPQFFGEPERVMRVDFASLFQGFATCLAPSGIAEAEGGRLFHKLMRSLVHFDDVVIFAYRAKERPIDLFSTFDPEDHEIFVSLYQAGPYLLDPFYHAARTGKFGVHRMRDLAPDRFYSSEYYRTYYVQTQLAEEVGFFIPGEDDVTVVVSLMRRESSGYFTAAEFAVLSDAGPFVGAYVAQAWKGLPGRFDALSRGSKEQRADAANGVDKVWRKLNLTDREAAIVELVLQGYSSESIGLTLDISTGTVKVHRRNVYRKLGISSQMQLMSVYLKNLEQ